MQRAVSQRLALLYEKFVGWGDEFVGPDEQLWTSIWQIVPLAPLNITEHWKKITWILMTAAVSQQCNCERNRITSVPWCRLESVNSRSSYLTSQNTGDYLRNKTAASTLPTFVSLSITAVLDGTGHSYDSQAPCYIILSLGLSWA